MNMGRQGVHYDINAHNRMVAARDEEQDISVLA